MSLEPEAEEKALSLDPAYPLVLQAGRRMSMNANTIMRDPAWNEGKHACTSAIHLQTIEIPSCQSETTLVLNMYCLMASGLTGEVSSAP